MKVLPKLFYFLCFVGLAAAAALALDRAVQPSMSDVLLRAVVAAGLASTPGLIYRKAWPVALLLLPLGAYVLVRTTLPIPALVDGLSEQYNFYAEQLREGGTAYLNDIFPLKIGDVPGLRLLIALSVYTVVGTASFLALSLRRAVPGLACLLVLVGFSLTVDADFRDPWMAILFVVLASCLLVLSRGIARTGWRFRDTVAGGLVGGVAALLAVFLLVAAPSTVATPWQDWRTWDPFREGGSMYSFNWMQNYPRLLDPVNDQLIMRVESQQPSYWRANALDVFTGTAWVTSQAFTNEPERTQLPSGTWIYDIVPDDTSPPGETVEQSFQIDSVYTNYIFVGGDPVELRLDRELALRLNDMRSLHVSKSLGPTIDYGVTAIVPDLEPEDIIGKGQDYPRSVAPYLVLPFPRVAELEGEDKDAAWRAQAPADVGPEGWQWADLYLANEQIVGDATDPYDITLRIERHLRGQYSYSLTPPGSNYSSPYAAFLFDTQEGYCQHFAGVMALLLRYNGVPARVAVGFTSGEKETDGVYLVSTNNAHAWVEVYFPTVGWVAFDPTPGRNLPNPGPSSTSPGFINPFDTESGATGSPVTTLPRMDPEVDRQGGPVATGESQTEAWYKAAWLPWLLGLLVLALAWPVGRSLWKHRDLHRGPLPSRLAASLLLLRRSLADYGFHTSPSDTVEDIARIVQVELRLPFEPELVDRVQAVLFGERTGTEADLTRLENTRRHVKLKLRRHYGWMRTGLAWYGLVRRTSPRGTSA